MDWYPIEIRHTVTEEQKQESYDTIYATQGIRLRDSFYLWFLDAVRRYSRKRGRLLDVSCGEGTFLSFARAVGFDVVGIDFSMVALQKSQRDVGSLPIVLANAEQLPFDDQSFDTVTNLGSLEHYLSPELGVSEMARVLRPDGVVVLHVPNTFGLFGNIPYVIRHGEVFDDGQPLQRYATRASWERLLNSHGLRVTHVFPYEREWPRTRTDFTFMMTHPSKIVRTLIAPLVPVNLGNFLVYVCDKG